jgi:transposase
MIIPPGPLKVMVATKPVDFRKGAVGLAAYFAKAGQLLR